MMVAAGKDDIRKWFMEGAEKGYKYMIIVYDSMDFPEDSDSPYYAGGADSARDIVSRFERDPMCEVMEVYDLTLDMETQLAVKRAWNLPPDKEAVL